MRYKLVLTLSLLLVLIVAGCSDTDKTESEPGAIQQQAENIGHEAARMLKTPMDKANNVADKEELRSKQLEERLNKMD